MSQCINPDCLHRNPPQEEFCERCGHKLLLRERYRAIKPLSAGSFGKTFVAIDEDKPSRSYCVVKQFLPQAKDPFSLEKGSVLFEREARQLDELGKHPQIPELLAYFTEGNYKYLIQEYISGFELRKEQEQFGVFNEQKLLRFLYEILLILQFIHNRHIIHRDIKPENIIRRSRDRKLVLVDFGAVKELKGASVAPAGTVIGSMGYAAPEQWQGKATVASDLYSVGATSIYLLTGIQPSDLFDYLENQWIWRKKLGVNPISEGLGRILDSLLALPLSQRYACVEEVLKDWHALDNTSPEILEAEPEISLENFSEDNTFPEFCFVNENEPEVAFSSDTEGSEIETNFFVDFNSQPASVTPINPNLQRLLNTRKPVNPRLKKLLTSRKLDYIRVDIQVNSAFKIIEYSEGAARFATAPEWVQVGRDARRGFPELLGLEKIAAEIRQGQRQSLELKEICRDSTAPTALYFDLYFTCDPGEFPSENTLMILIIDTADGLEAETSLPPEDPPLPEWKQEDELTRLANRYAFDRYFHEEWRHLKRQQRSLALILCELDYFEEYNETYGYAAGDQCLQEVASILQSVGRHPADMIARFSGKTFALILPDTEGEGALSVAQVICQELAAVQLPHQGALGKITVSCGVATLIPTDQLTPETLIQNADRALKQAQTQGRDRAVLCQD